MRSRPSRSARPFLCEYYADLVYGDDGRNITTREHHAVAPEEAAARVLRAVGSGVTRAVSGKDVPVVAESICVHSDTAGVEALARAVHEALAQRQAA